MDLKSGYPFWALKNGLMHAFPPLQQDLRCDVAIIGGGITGALIADELAAHGHDVAVLDQRDIGWGSTSASTALLQNEIATHMIDLAKRLALAGQVPSAFGAMTPAAPVAVLVVIQSMLPESSTEMMTLGRTYGSTVPGGDSARSSAQTLQGASAALAANAIRCL